jgi:drug/metabolite transporter (DMT)-like permease
MIYVLSAMVLYTIAILLTAFASRNINSSLVAAISNSIAAIIPVAVIVPILSKNIFASNKAGVFAAVLAGVAIAFFALMINKSYITNKVGIIIPIVFGGSIFLSTVLSYVLFKEKVSPIQGTGLVLLGIGLLLIIYSKAISE